MANVAGPVSVYLRKYVPAARDKLRFAIDLPCGLGRNSIWLAMQGYEVVSADLNARSVQRLKELAEREQLSSIFAVVLDARNTLPFSDGAFDLCAMVHHIAAPPIDELARIVKPAGLLVFETFGGHGENWLQLPRAGAVAEALQPHFDVLHYAERKVGPASSDAVVVRTTAKRRLMQPLL
jgi:SAM-dependent methyltransferase